MTRAAKVCSCTGCEKCGDRCPDLVPDGKSKCSKCRPEPWSGGDQEARARRGKELSSAKWQRTRAQVLRMWPICYVCGQAPSEEADHIKPDTEGGKTELENLAGICGKCHRIKTGREGARARNRSR